MTIKSRSKSHPLARFIDFDCLVDTIYNLFGPAGPAFVRHVVHALQKDREEFVAFVKDREEQYRRAVADLKAPGRDLLYERDKFARIYAVYCAAIRFKICSFTEAELLEAVMTCERHQIDLPAKGARPH